MSLEDHRIAWLAALAHERLLAANTVEAYGRDLGQFLAFLGDPQANPGWLEFGGEETLRSYGVDMLRLARRGSGLAGLGEALRDVVPEAHVKFLRRLPVLNARIRPGYEAMLAQLDTGRLGTGDLRDYLLSLLPELNPWDSLVYFGLVQGWTDFVKKANLKDAGNARRFLKLADADRLALMPEVRAEIAALALR